MQTIIMFKIVILFLLLFSHIDNFKVCVNDTQKHELKGILNSTEINQTQIDLHNEVIDCMKEHNSKGGS